MCKLTRKFIFKGAAVFSVAALFLFIFSHEVQALRLTAKQIIFEGSKRAEDIVIINKSSREETYRVGWRPMRMYENSALEPDADKANFESDPYDVSNMVKFAPRRFSVPPNGSQQLRIMLRLPADLPDGEYRNHLFIDTEKLGNELDPEKKRGVTLMAKPGATIPVFVRKGNLSYEFSVNELLLEASGSDYIFTYDLGRTGNRSVYVRMELICNPDGAGAYPLRTIKGLALYTDIERKRQTIKFPKPEGRPACTSLRGRFFEDLKSGNKLLAEHSATVYNN